MASLFRRGLKGMAKLCLLATVFVYYAPAKIYSQSYPSLCGLHVPIPDNSCANAALVYPIAVGGVAGSQLGVDVVLASVDIIISHPWDSDVEVYLQSPYGPAVELTIGNGAGGNNYGDPTDPTCTAVTRFSRSGVMSITAGTAPFIGSFRPQGDFSDFDDGSSPNGEWHLIICDAVPASAGTLEYVRLQFTPPCEQPDIAAVQTSPMEARVEWTSLNSGAAYTITWGAPGFTPGINALGSVTGTSSAGVNSHLITGLSPSAAYELYLSENCGDLQSLPEPYSFATPKLNDICANATPVGCGVLRIDSTNTGATDADAPGSCSGLDLDASPGLWYVYEGNGADVIIDLCGPATDYDTRIGVFEGPCYDLTCVAANDNFCGIGSGLSFTAEAGKNYYIYVTGTAGAAGSFEMNISCAASIVINEADYAQPGADDAEFIELLNTGAATLNLNNFSLRLINGTAGGTSVYNTIDLPDFNLIPGSYFVICGDSLHVANCNMQISHDFLRDGSPDAIALYLASTQLDAVSYNGTTGLPYTEGSGVGLYDDSTAANSGISRMPDGYDTDVNNADFAQSCISPGVANVAQNASCTVPNDSCDYATVIQPAARIPFDNRGATTDGSPDGLCSFGGSTQIFSDIWFSFTPSCDGIATFSTDSVTTYDSKIAVYLSPCPGTIIDCNDDISGSNTQSEITWAVTSGTTYLLRLGSWDSTDQGHGVFNLALAETEAPIITCSADRVKNCDPGLCTATVNPLPPSVSDNCSEVTFTNDFTGTASALGSYPVGTTVITWTAADASGNTATCQHHVTVIDNEKPVITCPADIIQTADADTCGAFVAVPPASVSDNCSIDTVQNDFTGTSDASGFYMTGIHTVYWAAEDVSGNSKGCFQTIIITDNQKPAITCPADYVIPSCDSHATVPSPVAADNCGIASVINSYNFTSDASGVYHPGITPVTWTVTDFSWNTASCVMNVIRNLPPRAAISPDPAEACVSQNKVLRGNPVPGTAAIASHLWVSGGITGAVDRDSAVLNVSTSGVFGPVAYTVTDANGCSASDFVFVTILDTPIANIIADTVEICQGSSARLDGNPAGGNGAVDHLWTGDIAPLSSADVPNPDFIGSAAGIYSLTYIVTDSKGCSGSDAVTVAVNTNPVVSITPNPAVACEGASFVLNAHVAAGVGTIISQGWSGDTAALSSTTITNPAFDASAAGAYTVSFSVADDNFCSAAENVTVTIHPKPDVSFDGLAATYCSKDDFDTLRGTPAGGIFSGAGISGLPLSFDYPNVPDSILDGSVPVENVYNLPILTPGAALGWDIALRKVCFKVRHGYLSDLDVRLESPNGEQVIVGTFLCGDKNDMDVCITPGTGNSIDNAVCNAASPAVTGTYHASLGYNLADLNDGSSPNGVWKLLITDNNLGDTGSLLSWTLDFEYLDVHAFTPAQADTGTHTISYTYTDGNGCSQTENKTVTVYTSPAADAGADTTVCPGEGLVLTATGGDSYRWSTGDSSASVVVSPAITTDYYVTATNAFGCHDKDDVRVNVRSVPAVSFTGLRSQYCLNDRPDTLSGFPAGGFFSGAGVNTSDNTFEASAAGAGTTTVTYTYTDGTGCTSISSMMTAVFDVPVAAAAPDTAICHGGSLLLQASGGVSYHWSTGDSNNTITVTVTNTTAYIVTVTDINGCTDEDTAIVTLLPAVVVEAGMNQTVCSGSPTMLTASGGLSYSWSTGELRASITVAPVATTVYSVTATDANGCAGTDAVTVNVLQRPLAMPGADGEICAGETVDITASGGSSYSWSDGIITINDGTRPASPSATTTYTVVVSDAHGCSDTASVRVTVHPLPTVRLSGLEAFYCNNAAPDTLRGTPVNGFFAGPAVIGEVFHPALLPPGKDTIIYTYITSYGCQASDTGVVTIHDAPEVTFSGLNANHEYCLDTSANLLTGMPSGGVFSGPGVSGNIFVSYYAGPGRHDIVYTYDGGGFCPGSSTQSVTVHALPEVSIAGLEPKYCSEDAPDTLTGMPAGGIFTGAGIENNNVFYPVNTVFGLPTMVRYQYTDAHGCIGKTQMTTTVYANPKPVALNPGVLCVNGGSVRLTGSPAGGTFIGAGISNNVMTPSVAGAGMHSVKYTVTDGRGCYGENTISISIKDKPQVTLSGIDSAYCLNAPLVRMTGMPPGGRFSGDGVVGTVFDPAVPGTGGPYDIIYTYTDSNGCTASDTHSVFIFNTPFIIISGLNEAYCVHEAPVPIMLIPAGGILGGTGIVNGRFDPGTAGIGRHVITYQYENSNGCAGVEKTFVNVENCVGVNSPDLKNSILVYPNPTEGRLTLEINGIADNNSAMRIYTVTGKLVFDEKIPAEGIPQAKDIDLSSFAKGVYYLKVSFHDGTIVRKVVVQ